VDNAREKRILGTESKWLTTQSLALTVISILNSITIISNDYSKLLRIRTSLKGSGDIYRDFIARFEMTPIIFDI